MPDSESDLRFAVFFGELERGEKWQAGSTLLLISA